MNDEEWEAQKKSWAEERQRRNDELQRCLQSALSQVHNFVEDDKKVKFYNEYVDTIIFDYQSVVPSEEEKLYYHTFKINSASAQKLKSVDFTIATDDNAPTARLLNYRHIQFTSSAAINFDDDTTVGIIRHELLHGMVMNQPYGEIHRYGEFNHRKLAHLSPQVLKNMRHAHEIIADGFSDCADSSPGFHFILKEVGALKLHDESSWNMISKSRNLTLEDARIKMNAAFQNRDEIVCKSNEWYPSKIVRFEKSTILCEALSIQ